MTTFKDVMASDNADVFLNPDDFAYPALYTPVSAFKPVVWCVVILDHDVILQPSSYDARVVETGSTITALYADVGEPAVGSTFEVDGVTYKVARITDNDMVFVTMAVVAS
jgi:hypothetical protein